MDPVSLAIGGGAVVGAGTSIWTGLMQSQAAKQAAAAQQDALMMALQQQQGTQQQLLQYFDPFRQIGMNAGLTLQGAVQSPEALANSRAQQRVDLQTQLDALNQKLGSWGANWQNYTPVLSGPNASERRATISNQLHADLMSQQQDLQQKLSAFDQQTNLLTEQAKQTQQNGPFGDLTKNPIYNTLANATDRRLSAQGLLGSRAAIEQEGSAAANTAQLMLGNLQSLYGPTVGATASIAGDIGQLGQAQAQTIAGIGQAQAQGILGSNNALTMGITGATNALTGAGGSLLNYNLYSQMINKLNTGSGNGTSTSFDPVMGSGTPPKAGTGTDYNAYFKSAFGMT